MGKSILQKKKNFSENNISIPPIADYNYTNKNYKSNSNNANNRSSYNNYEKGLSNEEKNDIINTIHNYDNNPNNNNNLESINNNLEKNNLNNNFLCANNRKNLSFLPSESMLSKHINKQKNLNYNIAKTSSEAPETLNSPKKCGGYQRHFASKQKEALKNNAKEDDDSSFEEMKNLENIVFIRAKLESKKNQLKALKNQYDELSLINNEISEQLGELENYRASAQEKIRSLEENIDYNANNFLQRENEMINSIRSLEDSKGFLEEKYVKLCAEEKLKEREMELLNQKIKDMEIILEEL